MSALPNFALGRLYATLTLAGCTVASDGTITVGTARSIVTQVRSSRVTQENDTEDVSAISQRRKNMVIVATGTNVELSGWLFKNDSTATPVNWPNNIGQNNDIVQYVLSYNGLTWTGFAVIKSYEESAESKGGIPYTMQLEMVDPGSANPAQS